MPERILVIAAHADDEALGCGGTLARHVAQGDEVHLVFMADGVGSRRGDDLAAEQRSRNSARDRALAALGVASSVSFGLADNQMDALPLLDVVQLLERAIASTDPHVVYTHHAGDLNIDHRVTHQAVMTACRPLPGRTLREILAFEVPSSTEWAPAGLPPFVPDVFVDITATWPAKRAALEAYADELRPAPHARSLPAIEALATWRGHTVGLAKAEAFMLQRRIVR